MTKIKTEDIDLKQIPMSQRKHIGMLCQRHMEDNRNPENIESLCMYLREHIDSRPESESRAARWLMARLRADPELARINCRAYICRLMYDI